MVSSSDYSKNRQKFNLVGSIQRRCTNFITTQRNQKTGRCSYVEDTSALTKRSKNEVVRFFMDKKNDKKEVAYLVVPKNPSKKSEPGKRGKK